MGKSMRVKVRSVNDGNPATFRLSRPSKPFKLSVQRHSFPWESVLVPVLIVLLLFFSWPFLLVGGLDGAVDLGTLPEWGMLILTAILGSVAVVTYQANQRTRRLESDLLLRKEFTDLLDRSLGKLNSIGSITENHQRADQVLVEWDVTAQYLARALAVAEKISSDSVRTEVESDLGHYQLQFNAYFQGKPVTHFFDLEFYRPFLLVWAPAKGGAIPEYFSPAMLQSACVFTVLAKPRNERPEYELTMEENFLADLDEYKRAGLFTDVQPIDVISGIGDVRRSIKAIVDSSSEYDRENSPLIGYVPAASAFNTILEFCSDVGEKDYSKNEIGRQLRGDVNLDYNPAEALYIQLNEFRRLPCGGLEAKRFPTIRRSIEHGLGFSLAVPFKTERIKRIEKMRTDAVKAGL